MYTSKPRVIMVYGKETSLEGTELNQEDQLRASYTVSGKGWWGLEQAGGPECPHVCSSHLYAFLATA